VVGNLNLDKFARIIGVCLCAPVIALAVTFAILTIRGRIQVLKNQRDQWLK
jgi:hypothetical protein